MPDTIEQAVRVLMAHSTEAAGLLAGRTPATSPVFQTIYNRVAGRVLADPYSELTPEQRELVANYITIDTQDETRSFLLRVRLTETERADLQRMADAAELDMSEFVRRKVFGGSDA